MLVLKRRQGQAIDVGNDVKIILKDIQGGHVKVAIVAPKSVRVKRSEVTDGIERENLKAAQSSPMVPADLECLTVAAGLTREPREVETGD